LMKISWWRLDLKKNNLVFFHTSRKKF
jgi:hypothetical protein